VNFRSSIVTVTEKENVKENPRYQGNYLPKLSR
jgi:hypothetical protein